MTGNASDAKRCPEGATPSPATNPAYTNPHPDPVEPEYWMVELGPFKTYGDALGVGSPIHAGHEGEYGIALVGYKDGEPVKVVV